MWNAGPTWLLVITVLEVISLIFTDSIPLPHHLPYENSTKAASEDSLDIEMGAKKAEGKLQAGGSQK